VPAEFGRRVDSLPERPKAKRLEGVIVNSWDLMALDLKPRLPEILSSSDAARAIALDLAAGECLADHQVHERAWLIVLSGEIEVSTHEGGHSGGGAGLVVEFAPGERHEVTASADSRLLLLLTPWPGSGHPGAMTIREKLYARRHAAKQAR
jgi:quercetin dioxygenase-like cupin family protein